MLKITSFLVAVIVTSHLVWSAVAGAPDADNQVADARMFNASTVTGSTAAPDIDALRVSYANCLKSSVKRYNDGLRESPLVAEMTTHACAPALYEIRWTLQAAGTPESEATAYAARLQVRARNKLTEMVANGF